MVGVEVLYVLLPVLLLLYDDAGGIPYRGIKGEGERVIPFPERGDLQAPILFPRFQKREVRARTEFL